MHRPLSVVRRSFGRSGRGFSLCCVGPTVTPLIFGAYFWNIREVILLILFFMSGTDTTGPVEQGSTPSAKSDNLSQLFMHQLSEISLHCLSPVLKGMILINRLPQADEAMEGQMIVRSITAMAPPTILFERMCDASVFWTALWLPSADLYRNTSP